MKKSIKNKLLFATFTIGGTAALISSSAVLITSCSSNYDTSIAKQLKDEYLNAYNQAMGNQYYYQLTSDNQPKVLEVIDTYITKVDNQIEKVKKENAPIDLSIWLGGLKYELITKKKLIESNIRYIIVNSNDQMIMTNYSKYFQNQVRNVAISWGTKTASQKITELNRIIQFINDVKQNLSDGLAAGVTWSGVLAKHTIGNMLQLLYRNELVQFVEGTTNITKGTLFTNNSNYNTWKNNNPDSATEMDNLVQSAQSAIDSLMSFLINTYYPKIKYGFTVTTNSKAGTAGKIDFKVIEQNPNEEDNSFSYTKDNKTKYIQGLGLSKDDLETKDIGIGFSGIGGQNIYKALLQKHTNIVDVNPQDQYQLGLQQVGSIKDAMTNVANFIGDLKYGPNSEWTETFYYDADSSGDASASEAQNNIKIREQKNNKYTINLENFFKWLNSDQFFNGRDMTQSQFPTIDGKTILNNSGITDSSNKTPYVYQSYKIGDTDYVKNVIGYVGDTDENKTITYGDAGNLYVKYIEKGYSPSTIQQQTPTVWNSSTSKSISPAAAYIGASNAVSQYLIYKQSTAQHLANAFKTTSTDYTLRTGTGGAAYASSGAGGTSWVDDASGGFYLDVNPYFGLQKWSMSTLSNHEGVTGHVFQFNYAVQNPGDTNAVSYSSTAYAEGWGLFSEWLATRMGVYGSPSTLKVNLDVNNNVLASEGILTLPEFGVDSKTNKITKFTDQYEYANGVYWIKEYGSDTSANSQSYYDALQYFGFLNERQLRAMRITVDVGLHAGANGSFTPGSGYSLKQGREYLQANSGLGIDDINRETKRYLEYTAQATSYYNGLIEMQNYFLKASALYQSKNPNNDFLNWQEPSKTRNNTSGLFDLILRNGSTPLPVLSWAVNQYLNNLYK